MAEVGERGAPSEAREKKSIEIICRGLLQEIRDISAVDFVDCDLDDQESLQRVVDKILSSPIFDERVYGGIKEASPYLKKFMGHDLGNLAMVVIGNTQLLQEKKLGKYNKHAVQNIMRQWPVFSLIMEDICLRGVSKRKVDKEYFRDFDLASMNDAIGGTKKIILEKLKMKKWRLQNADLLGKSAAAHMVGLGGDRVDVSVNLEEVSLPDMDITHLPVMENEELVGAPGAIVNAVCNIMRNAAGEYLKSVKSGSDGKATEFEEAGAEHVAVEADIREDDEGNRYVVFTVVDDGKGMSADYLQEGTKKNIFQEGRSHRESSGYGLTNLPGRLHSMQAKLRVWSMERDKETPLPAFFDSSGALENKWRQEVEEESLGKKTTEADILAEIARRRDEWILEQRALVGEKVGFTPSTVFELWGPRVIEKNKK